MSRTVPETSEGEGHALNALRAEADAARSAVNAGWRPLIGGSQCWYG